MKSSSRLLKRYIFFLVVIGLGLLSVAVSSSPGHAWQSGTFLQATPTVKATVPPGPQPGSTDGLVVIAVFIFAIIIVSTLWKRKEWSRQS